MIKKSAFEIDHSVILSLRDLPNETVETSLKKSFQTGEINPSDYVPSVAVCGTSKILEFLVLNGGHIGFFEEIEEKQRYTALHLAADNLDDRPGTLEYLISIGADIEARDSDGRTPLFWTTYEDNVETMQALIRAGADVNAQDNEGNTPLHISEDIESFSVLLQGGADPRIKDKEGLTPMDCVDPSVEREEVIRLMKTKAEELDLRDRAGLDGRMLNRKPAFGL